jgi:hypothetical protein
MIPPRRESEPRRLRGFCITFNPDSLGHLVRSDAAVSKTVRIGSSHVDGGQSELIVDSGHDAQSNPEAIHEVARILKENLAHWND